MTENAYDIRRHDKEYQTQQEVFYGVKMVQEDKDFYEDNCKGAYVATCAPSASKGWMKQAKRRKKENCR